MNTLKKSPLFAFALAAVALACFGSVSPVVAQSTFDDEEMLLTKIQTDKRAVVLKSMELDDAQMAAFIPVYDAYQKDRKELAQSTVDLINAYAANYGSMTDEAAGKLIKQWMAVEADRADLVKTYVKKLGKVLPATKVLRFVQIENKLNTVLSLPAVRAVPLAQ